MADASSSTSAPELYLLLDDEDASASPASIEIASQLDIPIISPHEASTRSGLFLQMRAGHLLLGRLGVRQHPVSVDFVSSLEHRRRGPELLLKAVGGGHPRPTVVDATAGLGRDSAILLAAGYSVCMIEENPVATALLNDALRRLQSEPSCREIAGNLRLLTGKAEQRLPELALEGRADVVYLDPMFAASGKSALVKKEMQLFQSLLGHGADTSELLEVALSAAKYRVVIKRAIKAAPLADREPTLSVRGKAVRFDVYALKSFKRQ